MLIIRPAQNKILAATSREEFLHRLEQHLRKYFQAVTTPLSIKELREIIERNWKRAEKYGLSSELGAYSYLNAVFTLGEDFPGKCQELRATLDADLSEEKKITEFETHILRLLQSANFL